MSRIGKGTAAGSGRRRRSASGPAWALAAAAVAIAVGLAGTVPGDVRVLRGLPQVVAWTAVALLAGALAAGGQRVAPFAVVATTLAATAALVAEGGAVGATALGIGAAGWLCLELACSSLEARIPRRMAGPALLRRLGDVGAVVVGGAVVSLATLTVATDAAGGAVVLRGLAALAGVALVSLVAWLVVSRAADPAERP